MSVVANDVVEKEEVDVHGEDESELPGYIHALINHHVTQAPLRALRFSLVVLYALHDLASLVS